ncbi:MAG: hypothetical protein JO286_20375 [Solirubrobacterales bacterium]|nr:hypothetical protein [Solirubrobacterales bacterium]
MTAERLVQARRERQPADSDPETGVPSVTSVLATCDRLLVEVGRRRHVFAWLRAPGSSPGQWLTVDAYYPRARLVVMCRPEPGPHDALYRELISAHGLGLLMLDPRTLGDNPATVEATLAAKLSDLEHAPPRPAAPKPPPGRPSKRAKTDPPAPAWSPVKVERTPVVPAVEQGIGMVVGLALAAVLIAEVYLDEAYVFGAGRVVLAFAIALEACSRALGTVAAARTGERAWACACAIGGAPVVVWFALLRRSGRVEVEPAPLAGLLAGLAGLLAVIALLIGH